MPIFFGKILQCLQYDVISPLTDDILFSGIRFIHNKHESWLRIKQLPAFTKKMPLGMFLTFVFQILALSMGLFLIMSNFLLKHLLLNAVWIHLVYARLILFIYSFIYLFIYFTFADSPTTHTVACVARRAKFAGRTVWRVQGRRRFTPTLDAPTLTDCTTNSASYMHEGYSHWQTDAWSK